MVSFKAGALYVLGNGDIVKMYRQVGVGGNVVVRKLEMGGPKSGPIEYYPGPEFQINLQDEKKRKGGSLAHVEKCKHMLSNGQADMINYLHTYYEKATTPSSWKVRKLSEEEEKARKRKLYSF